MPPDAITVLIPCHDNWDLIESTIYQLAPYFVRQQRQLHVVVVDNASRKVAPAGWPQQKVLEADAESIASVKVVRVAKRMSDSGIIGFGLQYARNTAEPGTLMVLEMEGQDRPGDVTGVLAAFEKGHCQVVFPTGKGWLGRLRARWSARLARIPLRWFSTEIPDVGSFRLRPRLKIGPVVETSAAAAPGFAGGRIGGTGFLTRWMQGFARRSPQLSALMLAAGPRLSESMRETHLEGFILSEEIRYQRSLNPPEPQEAEAKLPEAPPFPSTEFKEVNSEPTDVNQLGNLIRAIGFADGRGEDLTGLRRRMLEQVSEEARKTNPPAEAEPGPNGMSPVGVGWSPQKATNKAVPPKASEAMPVARAVPAKAEPRVAPSPEVAAPLHVPTPTAPSQVEARPVSPQQPAPGAALPAMRQQPAPQATPQTPPMRQKISIPRVHVPNVRVPAASSPGVAQPAAPAAFAPTPAPSAPAAPAMKERAKPAPTSAQSAAMSVTERMRAALAQSSAEKPQGPAGKSAMPMFPAASANSSHTRKRHDTAPIQPSPARMRVSVPRDISISASNGAPAASRPTPGSAVKKPLAQQEISPAGTSAAANRRPIVGNPSVAVPPNSKSSAPLPRPTRFRQPGSAPAGLGTNGDPAGAPLPTPPRPEAPVLNGAGPAAPSQAPAQPKPPASAGSNSTAAPSNAMDVIRRLRAMRGQSD